MKTIVDRCKGHVLRLFPRGGNGGRSLLIVTVACLVWLSATWPGLADMRIVSESDGQRTEVLLQRNRIASPAMEGGRFLLYCDTGEIVVVGPEQAAQYWQGTMDELQAAFAALFDQVSGASQGIPGLDATLADLFAGPEESEIQVRVTKVGEETIAGYATDHYRVETRDGDDWRLHEELWLSRVLHQEMMSEVGACMDMMLEFGRQLSLMGSMGMGERKAVLASPDYQKIQGFPVRNRSILQVFGMTMETRSQVVEVSRDPIPESVFAVPAGYRRVESPLEVFGM